METKAITQEKTNKTLGLFYSFGEVGSQLSWYMINSYLTLFYTDIVGLSAAAISFIMLVARIWDAANDPMMGLLADRTQTRWGKFRPYLMIGPPFLAVFNILTFTVFPVEGAAKVAICLSCYIATGMAYTVVNLSYSGLLNRIARDSRVRTNYAAAKSVASAVISMLLSAFAMPVILYFSTTVNGNEKAADARGYLIAAVILSVLMLPAFWLCAWRCKETVVIDVPESSGAKEKKSILRSLKVSVQNKMLLIIILNTFMGAMGNIARMSLLSYYVIYVVGSYTMIAPIYTTMSVFQLIGSMLIPYVIRLTSKRNICILMNTASIISLIAIFLFGAKIPAVIFIFSAVIGYSNSTAGVGIGMVCDCIEYGDWKYGIRDEALPFAVTSFSVKLATAITGSVGVLLLAAAGYVAGAEQSEAVKMGINAVVNLIPAACFVVSTIPLFFYKLDDKMMRQIASDLDERKMAAK